MNDAARESRAWIRRQTKEGRRAARPAIVIGLISTALAIARAAAIAFALSALLDGGASDDLVLPVAALALIALARAGLMLLAERAAFGMGASARRRLRSESLGGLLSAPLAALRHQQAGELVGTIVDRIEALDGLFARWVPAASLAVLAPGLVLLACLVASPISALVLLGCGVLVPVAMALSGLGAAAASRRQFAALTRLQARFLDRVRGIATIVLAGRAEAEAAALARAADELRRRTMRVLRVAFLSSAALDCAMALAIVVLAIRFARLLAAGHGNAASPFTALFVLLLAPEFFAPLRAFSAAYQDRLQATAAGEALLALPRADDAAPVAAAAIRHVSAHGVTVAFDNVRLRWDPTRPPALDGLSFRVSAGETLVLAGPSGAGKSSVIEILLGFVRPEAGRVTINGADIADIVPSALARMIAWIGQRPVLFAGTLRQNISFARPDASELEIAQAAAAASVTSFAETLPLGLETVIGEGGYGLSGGQAQRVAIARAFLRNAPLLLLDEPTAHLDPATEGAVLDSLRRLAVGRTVILASHSAAAHAFGAQAFGGRRLDLRHGRAASVDRGAA